MSAFMAAFPVPNSEFKKLPPHSPFLNIVKQAISALKAGNFCRKIGTYDVRRKYKTMLTMEDKRRVLWCFCEWPIVWSSNLS